MKYFCNHLTGIYRFSEMLYHCHSSITLKSPLISSQSFMAHLHMLDDTFNLYICHFHSQQIMSITYNAPINICLGVFKVQYRGLVHICTHLVTSVSTCLIRSSWVPINYLVQLQIGLQPHQPLVDNTEEPCFSILFVLTTKLNTNKILTISILTTSGLFSVKNINMSIQYIESIRVFTEHFITNTCNLLINAII